MRRKTLFICLLRFSDFSLVGTVLTVHAPLRHWATGDKIQRSAIQGATATSFRGLSGGTLPSFSLCAQTACYGACRTRLYAGHCHLPPPPNIIKDHGRPNQPWAGQTAPNRTRNAADNVLRWLELLYPPKGTQRGPARRAKRRLSSHRVAAQTRPTGRPSTGRDTLPPPLSSPPGGRAADGASCPVQQWQVSTTR